MDTMDTLLKLHKAIKRNAIDDVKALLAEGVPLDKLHDGDGEVPLTLAATQGRPEIIKLLLEAGADLNGRAVTGGTALHYASDPETAEVLIKSGADVNAEMTGYGTTPLHLAACNGLCPQIRVLLKHGADVEAGRKDGHTPLTLAAGEGKAKAVEMLVAAGADVNHRGQYGITPLMEAASGAGGSRMRIVKLLLEFGAPINDTSDHEMTALMYACQNRGSVKLVQTLIDAGADVDVKTSLGDTALSIAQEHGREDLVRVLLSAGAK